MAVFTDLIWADWGFCADGVGSSAVSRIAPRLQCHTTLGQLGPVELETGQGRLGMALAEPSASQGKQFEAVN